ncbi:MAG TPA: ester cyclase [Steroidobacteraceae bacterium]|nr:ester cyclase [Steroidobacteraceae bacterium]
MRVMRMQPLLLNAGGAVKDPKQVVREFVAAHNRHDIVALMSYLSEDSKMLDVAAPIPLNSKADVRRLYEMIFKSLPDINFEITGMISEGNQVFAAFRTTGKGVGDWMGKDITGKPIDVFEGVFMQIENGQIKNTMFYSDSATLTKQLGYQTAVSIKW